MNNEIHIYALELLNCHPLLQTTKITLHIHLSRSKYLILCHCSPKFDWISLLLFISTKLTSFDSKVTSYGRKSPKRFLLVVKTHRQKHQTIKFVSFFFSFFPPICCHFTKDDRRWLEVPTQDTTSTNSPSSHANPNPNQQQSKFNSYLI